MVSIYTYLKRNYCKVIHLWSLQGPADTGVASISSWYVSDDDTKCSVLLVEHLVQGDAVIFHPTRGGTHDQYIVYIRCLEQDAYDEILNKL